MEIVLFTLIQVVPNLHEFLLLNMTFNRRKKWIQVPYLAWTADVCLIKKAAVSEQ